jgi:hypothetical protein
MVDDSLLPHIEKIQIAHHVINLQREEIDKQNTIIQTLQVTWFVSALGVGMVICYLD